MENNKLQEEKKKISPHSAIVMMVNAINGNKTENFYSAVDEYLQSLSYNGDNSYQIRRLLNSRPKKLISLDELPSDLKKIIYQNVQEDENVFLNPDICSLIADIKKEWDNKEEFRYHNISVRNKILLHGPTGNGKTTIAKYIAKVFDLPFVEVNSDLIIDSHLGQTGYKINKILTGITSPCILFWDEVDTIGRKRSEGSSDNGASNENDRMVNSVLTNLDRLNNDVIFISATNRKEILDSAFLRRFDLLYEVSDPSADEKDAFAKQLIKWYRLPESFYTTDLSGFVNFSEIKTHFSDQARKYVLSKI